MGLVDTISELNCYLLETKNGCQHKDKNRQPTRHATLIKRKMHQLKMKDLTMGQQNKQYVKTSC
jgi:hypothetical protein